jgi:hypothetical protein
MAADSTRIKAAVYNAALAPHLWSDALKLLAESLGAVGAAYIVSEEKPIEHAKWACLYGPGADLTLEYLHYYAALDPYSPVLSAAPIGSWIKLSEWPA